MELQILNSYLALRVILVESLLDFYWICIGIRVKKIHSKIEINNQQYRCTYSNSEPYQILFSLIGDHDFILYGRIKSSENDFKNMYRQPTDANNNENFNKENEADIGSIDILIQKYYWCQVSNKCAN